MPKPKHTKLLKKVALGEVPLTKDLLKRYEIDNSLRSDEKRARIAVVRPHIYRKACVNKLAEKMSATPPQNGLYYNILKNADLEEVNFPAITADLEQSEDKKDTNPPTT